MYLYVFSRTQLNSNFPSSKDRVPAKYSRSETNSAGGGNAQKIHQNPLKPSNIDIHLGYERIRLCLI